MKNKGAEFGNPKSVAIIGASNEPAKLGYQILDNLKKGGYRGKIYPVNLKEKKVLGLPAFQSVSAIKQPVDLVLVVIPAQFVVAEVEHCAKAGVKNFVIITAGFSETNEDGVKREQELKAVAEKYKLKILGPNCLGLINTSIKLNLSFAMCNLKPGQVGFLSQSGALGSAVLDWVQDKNFGFSWFVSLGNKAVLDENEFFDIMAKDKNTKLVVAYLESITHGQKFMEAVSKLSKLKPVAILKSGQTAAGAKAAMSHTGSMAGTNEAVLAGLKRAGAIILENPEEMFDLITLMQRETKPLMPELVVVSNAGGPLVLATDQAEKMGFHVAEFSRQVRDELKLKLPPFIKPQNPLDLIGDAPADRYRIALEAAVKDARNLPILVLLTPQTSTEIESTAKIIIKVAAANPGKLICTSFIGGSAVGKARAMFAAAGIPDYEFPEQAIRVIAKLAHNRLAQASIKPYVPLKKIFINEKHQQLDYLESFKLLSEYQVSAVETKRIGSPKDLEGLKYPVAMKVVGQKVVHKTERAAIALNLKNQVEAAVALHRFSDLLKDKKNYCIAQPMVEKGLEMIVGFKRDASFGPLVMVGFGGIYTEIFRDIVVEIGDLDEGRVRRMLKSLKSNKILEGARGQVLNINGLVKTVLQIAKLSQEHQDIVELDINPLIVNHHGVKAVDVRIFH